MLKNIRKEEGFTLVELLVVIVIIVALSAAAITTYLDRISQARDAAAKDTASQAVSILKQGIAVSNYTFAGNVLSYTVDGATAATLKLPAGSAVTAADTNGVFTGAYSVCVPSAASDHKPYTISGVVGGAESASFGAANAAC